MVINERNLALSIYKRIIRELRRSDKKSNTNKQLYNYVAGRMHSREDQNQKDLTRLGELIATYFKSQNDLREILSIYYKEECSTEKAARIVGLKLPRNQNI
ncbi:hypothetical protein ACQ4LE_008028 [Meloidogyne hapla]|uniref:Protein FMC1 homolog n=1 Tax=Meloidogyne hapla TaxID=6305 RepID=A0A1I8B2W2_MELHA